MSTKLRSNANASGGKSNNLSVEEKVALDGYNEQLDDITKEMKVLAGTLPPLLQSTDDSFNVSHLLSLFDTNDFHSPVDVQSSLSSVSSPAASMSTSWDDIARDLPRLESAIYVDHSPPPSNGTLLKSSDMRIFGQRPLLDNVPIVLCVHCQRPIHRAAFLTHLKKCQERMLQAKHTPTSDTLDRKRKTQQHVEATVKHKHRAYRDSALLSLSDDDEQSGHGEEEDDEEDEDEEDEEEDLDEEMAEQEDDEEDEEDDEEEDDENDNDEEEDDEEQDAMNDDDASSRRPTAPLLKKNKAGKSTSSSKAKRPSSKQLPVNALRSNSNSNKNTLLTQKKRRRDGKQRKSSSTKASALSPTPDGDLSDDTVSHHHGNGHPSHRELPTLLSVSSTVKDNTVKEAAHQKQQQQQQQSSPFPKKPERPKKIFDADHCCWVMTDQGRCRRKLTCRVHTTQGKKEVDGRSRPFEELVLREQQSVRSRKDEEEAQKMILKLKKPLKVTTAASEHEIAEMEEDDVVQLMHVSASHLPRPLALRSPWLQMNAAQRDTHLRLRDILIRVLARTTPVATAAGLPPLMEHASHKPSTILPPAGTPSAGRYSEESTGSGRQQPEGSGGMSAQEMQKAFLKSVLLKTQQVNQQSLANLLRANQAQRPLKNLKTMPALHQQRSTLPAPPTAATAAVGGAVPMRAPVAMATAPTTGLFPRSTVSTAVTGGAPPVKRKKTLTDTPMTTAAGSKPVTMDNVSTFEDLDKFLATLEEDESTEEQPPKEPTKADNSSSDKPIAMPAQSLTETALQRATGSPVKRKPAAVQPQPPQPSYEQMIQLVKMVRNQKQSQIQLTPDQIAFVKNWELMEMKKQQQQALLQSHKKP